MRVPAPMNGGTLVRTPFDSVAGLYDEDAVWPLVTGSVSVTSRTTFWGSTIATALPS